MQIHTLEKVALRDLAGALKTHLGLYCLAFGMQLLVGPIPLKLVK